MHCVRRRLPWRGDGGAARSLHRLDLDCADVCAATGTILSRQTGADAGLVQTMLSACAEACRRCAEECEQHAEHHQHCSVCAEACRSCEQACQNALTAVAA